MRVLFVCLGNICRSPTAEGVLRHKLCEAGLADQVEVASAGTGDWHVGKAPDKRSQAAAKLRGYDLSAQRAQQVSRADFATYDLILAMDNSNLRHLKALQPDKGKAELDLFLRRFQSEIDEVPDPYHDSDQGFETVLDLIERASDLLVIELKGRL
ncbi:MULTISPECIES: low molecular weight protein-tyrosine-phosphatase [Gammaproteobacteria]|uniref:low molecular weight protein-tyrosine-phosphatase n=1 Tax=Gammaproteobacteria TaxID=1236 RepID=UPI001913C7EE|nr:MULTISPECIES: low molecular weight protein-tyrosine-phosphatase [Gammaproteobacteria]MBK5301761.1 low molecular weight phosphotyrosine protein phosphatase [Bacillus sp. TH86]MBK5321530.1 low molecular weight phosphotyrosine protein phosphatase [Bacillus sp. TH59]MBK5336480.1 low molecular weight phosphotyrosine protein phosphatase [Bacillus sp. TH57]MBK5310547.1 low molecular weight phosphotyrosine protein phosphatase [Pseudomonas sp. TH71]MBK5316027.1 low molecular weight phosphotyrosine p